MKYLALSVLNTFDKTKLRSQVWGKPGLGRVRGRNALLAALSTLLLVASSSTVCLAAGKPSVPLPPISETLLSTTTPKFESHGSFKDSAAASHPWQISQGHALVWDGRPYFPVGGAFMPRVWVDKLTDANWQADVKALQTLKEHHVQDLYLYAGKIGLTKLNPDVVQKVLDYLDANGFRYGIEIASFPRNPLVGYVVKPAVYRDPSPPENGIAEFRKIPGLVNAFYMLVSSRDASIDASGDATVIGQDTARVTVRNSSDEILLLYPQRIFEEDAPESHLPDLWQDYDGYRDEILAFFRHIKLGPGFRFFLDPLTDKIGFNGEIANLVPATDGFRLDFQSWLSRKYVHNVDDLNRAWGIKDRDLPDFVTAARCVPLWYQSKGIAFIYDAIQKHPYEVQNRPQIANGFWNDLTAFRQESVRDYMNAIADVLKTSVADVPVIYKWTQRNPIFTNDQTDGGFDGLGMEAYGRGRYLALDSGGYTFAQAEESARTNWLIVSGTKVSDPDDVKSAGYESRAGLFNDWDYLREIGARGFFTNALQRLPEDQFATQNLAALPDQLDWLDGYSATLDGAGQLLADARIPVLWYPGSMDGGIAKIRQFSTGVWWLPTFRQGTRVGLSSSLQAYALPDPKALTQTFVVWSPHGALPQAQFGFGKGASPIITDLRGLKVKVGAKNDTWTIPLGDDPILIRNVSSIPLPIEVLNTLQTDVDRMVKIADNQKLLIQSLKSRLFYLRNTGTDTPDQINVRYINLLTIAAGLTDALRPYAWMEGETAKPSNFTALVPAPQASGEAYLSLDTDRDPPRTSRDGYQASYKFSVNSPGQYTIWLAGSATDSPLTSPFAYTMDTGQMNDVPALSPSGSSYGGRFVWSNIGTATLKPGTHTLTFTVTGHRPADDHYALDIDAICVTRTIFQPDGTNRPPIENIPAADVTPAKT